MAYAKGATSQKVERLRLMLEQWWLGLTFNEIGAMHGICRQRAQQILRSLGCVERHRRHRSLARMQAQCSAQRDEVIEAQSMMESAIWFGLTARQRGIITWLSTGLGMRAIAARTGGTPQSVRNLFVAARRRALGLQMSRTDCGEVETAKQYDHAISSMQSEKIGVEHAELICDAETMPASAYYPAESEPQEVSDGSTEPRQEWPMEQNVASAESEVDVPPTRRIRLSELQKSKPHDWLAIKRK